MSRSYRRTNPVARRTKPVVTERRTFHWWLRRMYQSTRVLTILLSVVSIIGLWYVRWPHRLRDHCSEVIYSSLSRAGFSVQHVYLDGQLYTSMDTLMKAIGVRVGSSIMQVDLHAIQQRLEKLPWVRQAEVERLLPQTLHIRLFERRPIALWQHQRKLHMVDSSGEVFDPPSFEPFSKAFLVVGENAPNYTASLLRWLQEPPGLFKEISSATWIGERRWNIVFNHGLEVKLPEEAPEKAWQYIIQRYREKKLFNNGFHVIDLRVPGKVYLR
jgi:cell division protein FtsQ